MPKIRATLVELWTRVINVNEKNNNIYENGSNNLYPYEIERVINNSPTAKRASYIMSKFISGRGVTNDRIVNRKKNYYLSDIVSLAAEDVSNQYGVFFWVGYGIDDDGNIAPNKVDVLDYSNCRISKEDDNDYKGKIYVKDYSKVSKGFGSRNNENSEKWYYPFNSNKEAVYAQMVSDAKERRDKKDDSEITIQEMVTAYRGQVFYLNLTPRYKYALSKFDSVYNDMDSEYRFGLYVNTQMREGFQGKVAIITQGLDDEEEKDIKKDFSKWLGAENSSSLYHMNVEGLEDLSNAFRVEQLKPQLDDKLFVENDKRIRRNVLGSANNLPEPLIYAGEGALFGTSGDTYREMKLFYQEQTNNERNAIEKALKYIGFETQIIPIVEEDGTDRQE